MAAAPVAGAAHLLAARPGVARGQTAAAPVLIVLRLAGGNDGLNTVVPFTDPAYYKARPRLAVAPDAVVRLDDRFGLHPALAPLKAVFDAGQLTVIHGVGFPDPPRSHAAATAVWDNGRADLSNTSDGWLRWPAARTPLPRPLWKERFDALAATAVDPKLPATGVHFAALSGFDTHVGQLGRHNRVLAAFAEHVVALWTRIAQQGAQRRVAILVHSEFGRTLGENDAGGTEHGSAGPVLLIAPRLHAGLVGSHPSLTDLDGGALRHTTDFRSVYASVLGDWLNVAPQPIVGTEFKPLTLFRA